MNNEQCLVLEWIRTVRNLQSTTVETYNQQLWKLRVEVVETVLSPPESSHGKPPRLTKLNYYIFLILLQGNKLVRHEPCSQRTVAWGWLSVDSSLLPSSLFLRGPVQPPPRYKVAGGLGSYQGMFCQIKCKQMTCTVDMATKQHCTQGWLQHLTLHSRAQNLLREAKVTKELRMYRPRLAWNCTWFTSMSYADKPTGLPSTR